VRSGPRSLSFSAPAALLAVLLAAAGLAALLPRVATAQASPRRTPAVAAMEKVGPAVVNITTEQEVQQTNPFAPFMGRDPFFDRFFRDFFERRAPRTRRSLGSGVVIDREGHVLTNEHVVARASRIRVSLADGRELDAALVGADPNNDIAVLRVESDAALPWVPPGRSEDLMVGEPVIAIGNPFGLSHSVTTGVISAVDRSLRTEGRVYHGFLQTDASINPGNSGGPLLNAEGELIAINTAIYQQAEGIGFAVPIDVARRVVAELIAHGEVSPVWLGLELQDIDADLRQALGLEAERRGALVTQVHEGAPAARAGVRRGDVVAAVDGHELRSARELYEVLARATRGQELALRVLRDGEMRTVRATCEIVPDRFVAALAERLLGLALEPHPQGGFAVAGVRSDAPAARIGFRPGDRVLRINGRVLADGDALRRALLDLRGRPRAILVVGRGLGRYHVTIPLA